MRTEQNDVNEGQQAGETMGEDFEDFKEGCQTMRAMLENNKRFVMNLMKHPSFRNEQTSANQHSEMKANVMLCYRHLEDARMRMGKAIQAYDGGVSCYPK